MGAVWGNIGNADPSLVLFGSCGEIQKRWLGKENNIHRHWCPTVEKINLITPYPKIG